MTNIYFLPAWGNSSIELLEAMSLQTPQNSCEWKTIKGTKDIFEADAFILQDYTTAEMESFLKINNLWEKTFYFSREVPGAGPIKNYPGTHEYSYLDGSSYLFTKWIYPNEHNGGISTSYDALTNYSASKKRNMLCVQSAKRILPGHNMRLDFIEEFCTIAPESFDLYGGITQDETFKNFSNLERLIENNKFQTCAEYKYCLAFDNGKYANYFGTQFTDSLLSWCVPIYWGAPNIEEFFPADSYISFDAEAPDREREINRIIEIINDPQDYDRRLPALTKARNLVLNKYNIWDTIDEVITTGKSTWEV